MGKIIRGLLVGAVAGLVVGYLIFGRVGGDFVNPVDLVAPSEGLLERGRAWLEGHETIRRNIGISGGVGAVAGVIVESIKGGR